MSETVPSAEKILDLLEVFLASKFAPMTVPKIMQKSGLKRNSCDRLLKVLEQRGFVAKTDDGKWMGGKRILRMILEAKE